MTKRNRKTREEMLAFRLAQVAKLEAQIEGNYQDEGENAILKTLKKRLRKTETELRSANVTLNGVAGSEGKGWSRSPISEKIEGTKVRLASQIETMDRADFFAAKLPFDVERLQALIEAAEAGEDIEFPDDLTPLANEQERTDEEHEAVHIAKGDVEEVNL